MSRKDVLLLWLDGFALDDADMDRLRLAVKRGATVNAVSGEPRPGAVPIETKRYGTIWFMWKAGREEAGA